MAGAYLQALWALGGQEVESGVRVAALILCTIFFVVTVRQRGDIFLFLRMYMHTHTHTQTHSCIFALFCFISFYFNSFHLFSCRHVLVALSLLLFFLLLLLFALLLSLQFYLLLALHALFPAAVATPLHACKYAAPFFYAFLLLFAMPPCHSAAFTAAFLCFYYGQCRGNRWSLAAAAIFVCFFSALRCTEAGCYCCCSLFRLLLLPLVRVRHIAICVIAAVVVVACLFFPFL